LQNFNTSIKKILSYTDYSFQTQGVLQLQHYFREFLQKAAEKTQIYEEMQQWKAMLSAFTTPLNGLESVNIEFIHDIWGLFVKYGKLCD